MEVIHNFLSAFTTVKPFIEFLRGDVEEEWYCPCLTMNDIIKFLKDLGQYFFLKEKIRVKRYIVKVKSSLGMYLSAQKDCCQFF